LVQVKDRGKKNNYEWPLVATKCFNRVMDSQEKAFFWQGKIALLVKIGSLSNS
jgi:hypothetical protein